MLSFWCALSFAPSPHPDPALVGPSDRTDTPPLLLTQTSAGPAGSFARSPAQPSSEPGRSPPARSTWAWRPLHKPTSHLPARISRTQTQGRWRSSTLPQLKNKTHLRNGSNVKVYEQKWLNSVRSLIGRGALELLGWNEGDRASKTSLILQTA